VGAAETESGLGGAVNVGLLKVLEHLISFGFGGQNAGFDDHKSPAAEIQPP